MTRITISLPESAAKRLLGNPQGLIDHLKDNGLDFDRVEPTVDGDDLCDICMRSGVHVSRTLDDGRTVCVDCEDGIEESLEDCE